MIGFRPSPSGSIVGVVVAAALSGCATPPAPVDIGPLASAEAYEASLSFEAPASNWPSDRWWAVYADDQLSALIAEGVADASDLRVAEARFARATAIAQSTRSALLPAVDAGITAGTERQSYNYLIDGQVVPKGWNESGRASLDLSWQLDFWGRNRAALAAARLDAEAAGAEAAQARLMVSTAIAEAYADLAARFAERDAAIEAVRVRSKTLALITGRFDQGLENNGAVERARSAEASAKQQVAMIDEQIGLVRNQLAALMGAGPDRGLTIERPISVAIDGLGLPVNLAADLLGRRPDIIAARYRAQAASSRISQARASFYPNVNLSAVIGFQSLGLNDLFASESTFGSAGPAVSLPIFDGGRLRANYRGAEADYALAVAQYDGALTNALRDVADAATSKRALGAQIDSATVAERSALAAWTTANDRYRGGLSSFLEVLTAEDQLITARRSVAQLRARSFALDIALVRALGGGFRV